MKETISLNINTQNYTLTIDNNRTLLDVLTKDIGLTGTKCGCSEGDCGACTVIIDGKAVCSCLILAIEAQAKKIITIEGLASEKGLHPLQQAFIDYFSVQCGFCTPGMIMSAKALLDKNPHPSEDDIRETLQGNLCRCTGYNKIVEAVLAVRENINNFK